MKQTYLLGSLRGIYGMMGGFDVNIIVKVMIAKLFYNALIIYIQYMIKEITPLVVDSFFELVVINYCGNHRVKGGL